MNKEEQRLIMSEEEMLSLEKIASERNMTIEEVEKYREYSSRSLNGEEWIEYLKLCEKAFKKTSKYLYIYEHEIKQINNYITNLQQENQKYKEVINNIKKIIIDNSYNELYECFNELREERVIEIVNVLDIKKDIEKKGRWNK